MLVLPAKPPNPGLPGSFEDGDRDRLPADFMNPGPNWLHASNKEALQKALEDEKAELQTRKLLVEAEERSQRSARIDAAAVPSKMPLERIDRYETSNRRHRYKLEKRLEELQSRRKEQGLVSLARNAEN